MFSTGRFRLALCVCVLLCRGAAVSGQAEASLYRVFMRDGTTLLSYGEFARVSDRVVVSVPVGVVSTTDPSLHLVSIPSDAVDWEKTDAYADAVRAGRYAGTRGPDDFAQLGNGVTIALSEIALMPDPSRKVAMAAEARQNVTRWIAEHYGYRAEEVARMASLFDQVIAEARAAAGGKNVDLGLIANLAAPPSTPLLPPPTLQESVEQALRAATLAPDATERISLLRAVEGVVTGTARASAAWAAPLRARLAATLAIEDRATRGYETLTRDTLRAADLYVRVADVSGVERVIRRALSDDDRLGQRRPQEMASLLALLDTRLDAARRLRLARDSWAARLEDWHRYRRAIAEPLALMQLSRDALDDIRRLAGPSRARLDRLVTRSARALSLATAVVPPAEAAEAHGLLKNAIQFASRAGETRRRAVLSGTMSIAWEASSAAAGAVMLLDRAAEDLKILDSPPKAPRRP